MITTDDLFKRIGQKDIRVMELEADLVIAQRSNVQLQERSLKLEEQNKEVNQKLLDVTSALEEQERMHNELKDKKKKK